MQWFMSKMVPGRSAQRRWLVALAVAALNLGLLANPGVAAPPTYNWRQYDFNSRHNGDDVRESLITRANVASLHRLFQVSLPSIADGAPAYLSAVSTPGRVRNLVFVTTKDGHIMALDAQSGTQIWSQQHGPGSCHVNNGSQPCYTTSSPAIDPSGRYVYSYGLDGYVHRHAVGDGTEITGGGWPELATLKGFDEKGSSALSIAATSGTAYLYVTNGGYLGDRGDYQGHVTTINLASGAQHVFNMVCSNQVDVHFVEQPGTPDCPTVQSAVWARAGVVYDRATNKIYLATGNGDFAPASYYWGDSVLALNPDGSGANGNPLDSYTPLNFRQLQNRDQDLGSTAPAILPVPATSSVKHLALQSGKDGKLRLLNLDNLSGQGGPGHLGGTIGPIVDVPQGGEVLTMPAVWVNPADGSTWVYVANDNGISALKVTVNGGTPSLQTVWQTRSGGTSPIIANGVLYYAGNNLIQALDPTTGRQLWQDTAIGRIHWESPIVDNGVLYITDESSHLTAYGL